MRQKRDNLILNILTERKSIDVSELSELLGVSQVTVRKDLDELEKRHLISREHGIARLGNPDDINGRLAIHYDEKMKIAKAAASLVSDGDTIMIESGSCCAITAALIAKSLKNATIISNSVFIADYIRKESDINIVLLGGIYQKDSQCLVGPMIRDAVANFNVKYLFSGTDGWSRRTKTK